MNKLISIIYLISLIHAWKEEIVDFSCQPRRGTPTPTDIPDGATEIEPSEVSCGAGETLVSCGVDGWNNIKGTYIDQSDPQKCIAGQALPLQAGQEDRTRVIAVAVCCTFPSGSIKSVSTITSTTTDQNGVQVITKCPSDSTLTGCQVDHPSGDSVRGSYPGVQQGVNTKPLQSDGSTRDTENQCIAEARTAPATNIRGGAQCIKTAQCKDGYAYDLDCVTTGTLTAAGSGNPDNMDPNLADDEENGNFDGGCPTDFNLVACNAYTTSHTKTLDDWYYTSNKACYVQQDFYDPLRVTGMCCKLTRVRCKDADWDGVYDRFDNCPKVYNPDQKDYDWDGKGDKCDYDIDGDWVPNKYDYCPYTPGSYYNKGCPEYERDGKGDNGKGQGGGRDYRDYKGNTDTGRRGRERGRGSDGSGSRSYSYSDSGSYSSSSSDSSSRGRRSRNRYERDDKDERREIESLIRKLEYEYRGPSKY